MSERQIGKKTDTGNIIMRKNRYYMCKLEVPARAAITSQPSVLNLILINLILSWLMGAAIIGPPNTKYTQSIEAYREKLL